MINEGVHLMGDGLMVSSAHTTADVDRHTEVFAAAVDELLTA